MRRRVVITGCGVVSPIGNNLEDFWKGLVNGKSGGGYITRFNTTDYNTKIAAEIMNFAPDIMGSESEKMDTFTQYAVNAAVESFRQSKLNHDKINPERFGVIVGSSNGGDQFIQENHIKILDDNSKEIDVNKYIGGLINSAPIRVSKTLGAYGLSLSICTACASGTNAIGEATDLIKSGVTDIMSAGGTDDGIRSLNMAGLSRISAMTQKNTKPATASRPFDQARDGFLMGAGAGMVILEEYEHAINRNAPILAEVIGYGATTDAFNIVAPKPDGASAAHAIQKAMNEANICPRNVDYINAHGTGTQINEKMEEKAIHRVFQDYGKEVPINAIKSMTGHMLGASGAIEVISTVLSINNSVIPRTINCDNFDKEIQLNIVRKYSLKKEMDIAVTNSFGFGGHNASLILKKV